MNAVVDNTPVRSSISGGKRPGFLVESLADTSHSRKRAVAQDAANRLVRMPNPSPVVLGMLLGRHADCPVTFQMALRIAGY